MRGERVGVKITYVIGNGFDAGFGLKTTYRDFLENYYLGIKNSSPSAERLKEVIKRDIDAWSDAELAFGKIDVQKFEQAKGNVYPGAFYSAYYDFREEMPSILRGCEDKVVDVVDEDVSYRFRQTLLSIHTGLSSEDRKRGDGFNLHESAAFMGVWTLGGADNAIRDSGDDLWDGSGF